MAQAAQFNAKVALLEIIRLMNVKIVNCHALNAKEVRLNAPNVRQENTIMIMGAILNV